MPSRFVLIKPCLIFLVTVLCDILSILATWLIVYSFGGIFLFFSSSLLSQSQWSELPPIPDKEGFAGLYAGISHGTLICAGGANFPEKKPWDGGIKKWYDTIYLLDEVDGTWRIANTRLPKPIAYGVTISYENQMILIGGNDSEDYYDDVISLEYVSNKIVIDSSFPKLPEPISNMSGSLIDGVIYISGGSKSQKGLSTNNFYLLDLKTNKKERQWKKGPTWPGVSRIQSVSTAKSFADRRNVGRPNPWRRRRCDPRITGTQ